MWGKATWPSSPARHPWGPPFPKFEFPTGFSTDQPQARASSNGNGTTKVDSAPCRVSRAVPWLSMRAVAGGRMSFRAEEGKVLDPMEPRAVAVAVDIAVWQSVRQHGLAVPPKRVFFRISILTVSIFNRRGLHMGK
eukprot:s292_g3.t1